MKEIHAYRNEDGMLTDKQSEKIKAMMQENIECACPYFLAYLQGDLDALRRWREDEPL